MSQSPHVEHAVAYLTAHLTRLGHLSATPTDGPFITLSRESGTGGASLAQELLLRMKPDPERPWVVYSGNLIQEMLRSNNLPDSIGRFLPEDSISPFEASVGELVGLHPDLWGLVTKTNDLIRKLARAGHVVLLGRGANFATHGIPHGVHVRIVASPEYRAARTAQRLSISREDALAANAVRDNARRRYVRATFNANLYDPAAYHLVLNAERLSTEAMAAVILETVSQVEPC